MNVANADIPSSFPRRVLLLVVGTTPQILTETLWALVNRETAFVPTEIHVMTTVDGAKRIELQLLKQGAYFDQFCVEYGVTGKIDFRMDYVQVIQDQSGRMLRDIVTPEDNESAADQIIEWIRQFACDDKCAIHACLAGGRKTMGFYLGYGMSLLGRRQDRLSHVLVTQDFENNHEFFYIPRREKVLVIQDMTGPNGGGRPVTTLDAKIWLAEIPFVRLGDGMPKELRSGKITYTKTVEATQRVLANNEILIDVSARKLVCAGEEIRLPAKDLAFYLWFARRRSILGEKSWITYNSNDSTKEVPEFLRAYLDILKGDELNPFYEEARKKLQNGFDGAVYWAQPKNKIKAAITRVLGRRAEPYLIHTSKRGKITFYSLTLLPSMIQIVD